MTVWGHLHSTKTALDFKRIMVEPIEIFQESACRVQLVACILVAASGH